MQSILGYGGKNAKMDKMESLTSRDVREGDKAHDWRVQERWKVDKYYPYWLVVDWLVVGHYVGLAWCVPSNFSGRLLRVLVTYYTLASFLGRKIYFVLYLEMISLWRQYCIQTWVTAQKGCQFIILEWRIPFLFTGFWILLGYCCSISRDLRNEI